MNLLPDLDKLDDAARLAEILRRLELDIGPALTHDSRQGPLFHYTGEPAFQSIIANGELWATHYSMLNDAEEMAIGERLIRDYATAMTREPGLTYGAKLIFLNFVHFLENYSLTKVADVYVASLSENGNLLSQWRAYGDRGAGYSIGFSGFPLPDTDPADAKQVLWLVRCRYDEEEFREEVSDRLYALASLFESYINLGKNGAEMERITKHTLALMLQSAASLVPRMKHSGFSEEKEWRLVVLPLPKHKDSLVQTRNGANGLTRYIPLDVKDATQKMGLSKIFVGPTAEPAQRRDQAAQKLSQHGYDASILELSNIPFRG